MGRITRRLLVAAIIVLVAGTAGAQTQIFTVAPPEVTGRTATGTAPGATMANASGTTTAGTTAGTTTDASSSSALAAGATIERIVAIARTVEPGPVAVNAFTVPAGRQLVVTDVLITNPNITALCGAAVAPSGAGTGTTGTTGSTTTTGGTTTGTVNGGTTRNGGTTTTGTRTPGTTTNGTSTTNGTTSTTTTNGGSAVTTTPTTTSTAVESGTGTLCVPPQTSLSLALTTGLEFAGGQSVMLANQTPTTTTTTTTTTTNGATAAVTGGPLLFHLRGFLVQTL